MTDFDLSVNRRGFIKIKPQRINDELETFCLINHGYNVGNVYGINYENFKGRKTKQFLKISNLNQTIDENDRDIMNWMHDFHEYCEN